MKITFLGTNGWYGNRSGNVICTLVESKEWNIIFDAGDGIQNVDRYLDPQKPTFLFLSHVHLDHVYGLHILPKFYFKKGLTIFVPKDSYKGLSILLRSPFTAPVDKLRTPVRIRRIEDRTKDLPFSVETKPLNHQDGALGYRIELDGRIVTYCCDTGFSRNAVDLARGCDLLIHECAMKISDRPIKWGHSRPQDAARVASEAGAERLILTHFAPDKYANSKERRDAAFKMKEIFKNVAAAYDGLQIKL